MKKEKEVFYWFGDIYLFLRFTQCKTPPLLPNVFDVSQNKKSQFAVNGSVSSSPLEPESRASCLSSDYLDGIQIWVQMVDRHSDNLSVRGVGERAGEWITLA